MRADAIHVWLQTKGAYPDGVQLLREAGFADEDLLFVLELGETSVSRRTLTEALQHIHDQVVEATRAVAVPHVQAPPTKAEVARVDAEQGQPGPDRYALRQLTPEQELVRKEAVEAMRTMSYYRSRLETLASDDDRFRDAGHIIRLDLQAVRAFARLDAWLATGTDPGTDPPPRELTEAEMRLKLRSLASSISRAERGTRKVDPAKLARWREERDTLKGKLDALHA